MRIDTATTNNGLYWWLFVRPEANPSWSHIVALLDSAGVIYSLGDHPREGLFPMFRHDYTAGEATPGRIVVQGTTYQTKRVTVQLDATSSVTWWFADGIGLVKEYSAQGVSIFSDDHHGQTFECVTELTNFEK